MKKSLLILICLSAFVINLVIAQSCTPNLTGPYGQIVPDTTVNLPHPILGHAYGTSIQFFVPADTTYNSVNVPIQDFTLNSIAGMPPGFTYTTNPSNGVFPGNAASCLQFMCASPGPVGTYPLTVYVTAHVLFLNQPVPVPDTIRGYKFVIDSAASGIPTLDMTRFDVSQNMPNPVFSGSTEINYSTPLNCKISFNVYNMLGQNVITRTLNAKQGINQIFVNSTELAPGIYMYSLNNGTQTITRRMVVGSR